MDLILWRHAEAEEARAGVDDLERALTRRGHQQAARVGAWLAARLPPDTRILTSVALRCQQTALALQRQVEVRPELGPAASGDTILAVAGWPGMAHPVLVVGHQPALGEAVARLLAIADGRCEIGKGAVWWLRSREEDGRVRAVLRAVQSAALA